MWHGLDSLDSGQGWRIRSRLRPAAVAAVTTSGHGPPNQWPGGAGARPGAWHHDLVAAVPELHGDRILLNAHTDEDVAAHVAGEDEETARRFGWWPRRSTEQGVRAAYADWARDWHDDGPRRTFAARDPDTGALVGGCELRIRPDGGAEVSYWTHAGKRGPGTRPERTDPAGRLRGIDRRHPPGSARRRRQPCLTARRPSRRLHPGRHRRRRRHRDDLLHPPSLPARALSY